jgi:hypothetical protein
MRDGISPITVQKWRERSSTAHTKMGSKEVRSTVLKADEEAIIVAFRRTPCRRSTTGSTAFARHPAPAPVGSPSLPLAP